MDDFNKLLQTRWGSEKWILEGWEKISSADQLLIKKRMDQLFAKGLPFEIKHDKLLYVYAFSLLAQLEVLAIQIPLKFKDKMSSQENKERMHQQLLDEIFHGLVFTKIVYLLCSPYSLPPHYNEKVELLCDFIRNENCPKVAVMLLNLIAEGWIEEAFKCYAQQDIAPEVFRIILSDEHRHVSEADLYQDIGMPDMNVMQVKLEYLEEHLLINIFLQFQYMLASSFLLGAEGVSLFIQSLNAKHQKQLKKINLQPGKKWSDFMHVLQNILPTVLEYSQSQYEIEMTPMRKLLSTQWDNSSDATMVSQFNLDITYLDFFNKKFPPETITTLMLQALSNCLKENDEYRIYLRYKKLIQSEDAYVGIIVQLPGCRDQIGTIVFKNCHELSVQTLAQRIRNILDLMVYCYQKREALEKSYPDLLSFDENTLFDFASTIYGNYLPGTPIITLSNIGSCGYTAAKSPLLKNESMKMVMLQIERKQVWNKASGSFEIQDHLPLSISADHRIFDGNLPVPQILTDSLQSMFQKMLSDQNHSKANNEEFNSAHFIKTIDNLLHINLKLGYNFLCALQVFWPDFFAWDNLLTPQFKEFMHDSIVN